MIECMSLSRSLYRIFDRDAGQGCHAVQNFTEADAFNAKGWGIFWTVNEFDGPRKKENCKRILSWAIDLDEGSKQEQLERIKSVSVIPSCVNETARGHHVYFDAKPGADIESYRDIVERLVDAYRGDKNAKDVCRILRVPAYQHWKGENPFTIKCIHVANTLYTEDEMRKNFPVEKEKEKEFESKSDLRKAIKVHAGGDLWEKIWDLDCEAALERVSGTGAVNCERYTFKRTSNGNKNIFVNGKGSSCFIDTHGRIGSLDGGGPTIFNWIKWFNHDNKRTVEIIKQHFPELIK